METSDLKENISCMGIVIAKNVLQPSVLIMKNDNEWVFPKGHQEEGETFIDTACREVQEETGVLLTKGDCKGQVDRFEFNFHGEAKKKVIQVYLFEIDKTQPTYPNCEEGITTAEWKPLSEALEIISHADAKEALKKAINLLNMPNRYRQNSKDNSR